MLSCPQTVTALPSVNWTWNFLPFVISGMVQVSPVGDQTSADERALPPVIRTTVNVAISFPEH